MLSLKIFFKIIPYIWPFLREMVLGNKPILKAMRDNKKKLFFILLILFSFGLNFVAVPRLVTMSMQYIALDKRYKELDANFKAINSSVKHPSANGVEQQVTIAEPNAPVAKPHRASKSVKKSPAKTQPRKEHFDEIRNDFARLKKIEEDNARLNY